MSDWQDAEIVKDDWQSAPIVDDAPKPKTRSEAAFKSVLSGQPISQFNDPRGAALTLGSSMLALPASGIAGLAGTVAGAIPGGESPNDKGVKWADATRDFLTIDPPNEASARVVESVGRGGQKIADVGNVVMGSLATTDLDPDHPERDPLSREQKQAVMDRYRTEGAGEVFGSDTLELTGSPAAAAFMKTLPTAATLAPGAPSLRGGLSRAPTRTPPVGQAKAPPVAPSGPIVSTVQGSQSFSIGKPGIGPAVDMTPTAEQIVQQIKKNKPENVADAVLPDVQTVESAQRLGVDLNPEHYSTNAAFQDVARALKTRPGSKLEAVERKALDDLSTSADNMVVEMRGSLDKAAVSNDVLSGYKKTIDALGKQADVAYNKVRGLVPSATRVNPVKVREYLDAKIAEFGGDESLLSVVEKQLLTLVRERVDGKVVDRSPTYAALDRVRRNVGDGFRNRGIFKDEDTAILSEVYGVLSDVQFGVADSFGAGSLYNSGRSLVSERKSLEQAAVDLFGRELTNSLVPKMTSAANALSRGDVGRFQQLMAALPDYRRAEVAATILGDVFAAGSRKAGLGQGFVTTYANLNRNPTAKSMLLDFLPPGAAQRFDDIGRVLTGIVKANQKPLANPSGSAGPIIKALEDGSGLAKMYQVGKSIAKAEGVSSSLGAPGIGAAITIGSVINKTRTPILVAADDMLTSPSFARAVGKAIEGQKDAANAIMQNSPQYNRWLKTLDKETAARVAEVGFIDWITESNDGR